METPHIDRLFARAVLRPLAAPPGKVRQGLFVFANGFLLMAVLAALAVLTGSPLVFPSLGPPAYVLCLFPLARSGGG